MNLHKKYSEMKTDALCSNHFAQEDINNSFDRTTDRYAWYNEIILHQYLSHKDIYKGNWMLTDIHPEEKIFVVDLS
jgi:hypothetical protein